jgi:hypothetical protein
VPDYSEQDQAEIVRDPAIVLERIDEPRDGCVIQPTVVRMAEMAGALL